MVELVQKRLQKTGSPTFLKSFVAGVHSCTAQSRSMLVVT
jgi:hypothetical protein